MGDTNAEGAAKATETTATATEAQATTEQPAGDGVDWKAEARKWEERAKTNKTALDDLVTKNQTVEATVAELRTKVDGFEAEKAHATLAGEVAKAKGVPVGVLRGATKEELEAHADSLKSLINPQGPIVPGQEKTPTVESDPLRDFTKQLFDKE